VRPPRARKCLQLSTPGGFVWRDASRHRLQLRVAVDQRIALGLDLVFPRQQTGPFIGDLLERLSFRLPPRVPRRCGS
jgi:hypothetical protein